MVIAIVAFTIESQISYIADFIPDQIGSNEGIAGFIVVLIIFAVTQYFILDFVRQINRQTKLKSLHLATVHKIVVVVQFALVGVIAICIAQILVLQQYNIEILFIAQTLSYGLWIATLALLAGSFLSWLKFAKGNKMIMIQAASMILYVINGIFGLIGAYDALAQQNPVIVAGDVAIFFDYSFVDIADSVDTVYFTASAAAYVLTWVGTVMLLRHSIRKIGRVKFWTIMGAAMVYYIIQFPLFALGYYTPTEETDADVMNNLLISSMSAVFTGIVFGAAFLSVARTLPKGSALRNHMTIAAYGFVLFYVAGSATMYQAAYPPYGLVAVSFTGLSCYLIYSGLYASATTVSQDLALRQSIRKTLSAQSNLLDSIGTAEMEKELQGTVLKVAKKAAETVEEETGVEPSMTDDEMKDYLEIVMNEMKAKR
jgi:hypothetical protein